MVSAQTVLLIGVWTAWGQPRCYVADVALGHSRPSHPAPMPTDVRYAPSSDQNIAAPRLVAMCHSRHFASHQIASLFNHLVGA